MNKQSYQSKSSECPTVHGWTIVGYNEHLGCIVYEFGDRARMRRIVESDSLDGDWLVFVDREPWAALTGSLEKISNEVKAELGLTIPTSGQICTPAAEVAESGL